MLDDKETHEVKLLLDKVHFALEFTSGLTRELDREQASQFNVFRYVRDDELGLSRIIADLLDPNAQHGQSVLFLREFLKLVCKKREWNELDSRKIVVKTEHEIVVKTENKIPHKRRIDIWIRIGGNGNSDRFCLAFENKPSASDGENQLIDYLARISHQIAQILANLVILVILGFLRLIFARRADTVALSAAKWSGTGHYHLKPAQVAADTLERGHAQSLGRLTDRVFLFADGRVEWSRLARRCPQSIGSALEVSLPRIVLRQRQPYTASGHLHLCGDLQILQPYGRALRLGMMGTFKRQAPKSAHQHIGETGKVKPQLIRAHH